MGHGNQSRISCLGVAFNDSPAGLAAWIADKFWAWSDHDGNLDTSISKDDLLTNVTLYWVTQSITSSMQLYYETQHRSSRPSTMTEFTSSETKAPLGFAMYPKEISITAKAWAERAYGDRLIHWTNMPRGGHFAALETPALLVREIRLFFDNVFSGNQTDE